MILKHSTIAIILSLLACCTGQKKVTSLNDWKGRTIEFGSGGGFTGAFTIYTLLENGQLFSQTGVASGVTKELPAADKKTVKAIFANAAKASWPAEKISEPGNVYSVLRFKHDNTINDITWGSGKVQTDSGYCQPFF